MKQKSTGNRTVVMKLEKASSSESLIFYRNITNEHDPGTQLTYRFKLKGRMRPSDLDFTLREILSRHFPDLLSTFFVANGTLYKERSAVPAAVLDYIDRINGGFNAPSAHIMLPLNGGRLFRFVLIKMADDLHELQLSFSHLVFDGECYHPFVELLEAVYSRIVSDLPVEVPSIPVPDYRIAPKRDISENDVLFWKDWLSRHRLGQFICFLKRKPASYVDFITVRRSISGLLYEDLMGLISETNSTVFRVIAAAVVVALGKYSTDLGYGEEFTIAHTVSRRSMKGEFGCFVNVVPLAMKVQSGMSPLQLIAAASDERQRIRLHQFMPSQQIIELANERLNRNAPIFNLVVNQSPGLLPSRPMKLAGLSAEFLETPSTGGPFDLGISFSNQAGSILLSVDIPEELANYQVAAGFADNLERVLSFFVSSPDQPISALDLGSEVRSVAAGAIALLDQDDDVYGHIVAQAKAAPGKTAVRYRDVELTYARLLTTAFALADRVTVSASALELGRGIGLLLGRSELLPAAMVASLMLKVPFVPLEPSLPPERLSQILSATGLSVIIADSEARAADLSQEHPHIRSIVWARRRVEQDGELRPRQTVAGAGERAYILFTSGSTGLPKGIAITRRNLLNFMRSMEDRPGATPDDHFLALTPISFDISILELLFPLFVGASLEVLDDEFRFSGVLLGDRIASSGATVVQATPSTWTMLKNNNWSAGKKLKILCGGEPLKPDLASYLMGQGYAVYNMYGPTETTIWSSCSRLVDQAEIHLGAPVFNTRYYIVDASLRTLPHGMVGELAIAGECVSEGYLDFDPKNSFITIDGTGEVLYRTGDLVRSFGDGQIAYVGRKDNQRKINGYRIELDEISSCIKRLAGDLDVITVVRQKPEPHLCAFYQSTANAEIHAQEILARMGRVLPSYMIPNSLVRLENLPLTANGKVDMKRLETEALDQLHGAEATKVKSSEPEKNHTVDDAGQTGLLREIVRKTFDVDVSDIDMSLGSIGFNSISYNLLSHALEKEIGVHIPPHRFYALNTFSAISRELKSSRTPQHSGARQPWRSVALDACESQPYEPIAIVGYSVVMPDGLNAPGLWEALLRQENLISTKFRSGFASPRQGGFLRDIEGFDPKFFSISPLEANYMDPRQRLLLETSWHAVEDAGYTAASLAGQRIGCYVAATGADYALLQARSGAAPTPYSLPGNSFSMLANRISSFFDWKGPSSTLDTACSGSLIALVKACHDLSHGISDAALVGAVNIIADEQISQGLEAGNFMSPSFRCAAFDETADGYVRGEGVASFMLKRLSKALESRDGILGVIFAYRENHGGRSSSLTAPNVEAQTALLEETYSAALASRVSYIETHGTGTRLGDPIEIDGLKAAWQRLCKGTSLPTVWLGAMKSNIGHLEAAAGAASLAKVLLALEHRMLPPNNCFKRLNPYISLEGSPFKILTEAQRWESDGDRVAGISSFGFGGSNGHIVVGDPPTVKIPLRCKPSYLFTVSARTEASLREMQECLRIFLQEKMDDGSAPDIESVSYTLNAGRTHFEYRTAWIAADLQHLVEQLRKPVALSRVPVGIQPGLERLPGDEISHSERLEFFKEQYLHGEPVDWHQLHKGESCLRAHLPTYVFDNRPFWFDRKRSDVPLAATMHSSR